MQKNSLQKPIALFGLSMGIVAIVLQFCFMLHNRTASVPETIVRFFSFFTILTNFLVAVAFTSIAAGSKVKRNSLFFRPSVCTAVTVYILVVGLVYNVILRWQWHPKGWEKLADELLHTIIPLYVFLYWWLFVPAQTLKWKNVLPWLLYPMIYCIYTLIRGSFADFYPYPFMDVMKLGYSTVLMNSVYVMLAILIISFLLVAVGKWKSTGKVTA